MAVRDGVGGIADITGLGRALGRVTRDAPTEQARALKMEAGGLRLGGREVCIALPGVGAGLEAGRIFEVEAGGICARLVFQVVGEEPGFNLSAILLADGLGVIEVAEMARG